MSVTLINYQISTDAIAGVHRTGCRDIKRTLAQHAGDTLGEFESISAAIAFYIDAETRDMGWTGADVEIFPCAHDS